MVDVRLVLSLCCIALHLSGPVVQSAEPGRTSRLVIGMVLEPPHLDPTAGAAGAIDEVVYGNVFEGLVRIGADGTVLPALARRWTVSADGKDYRFELVENATFHDGTPFDSKSVVHTFERARSASSTNAQKHIFSPILSVEALSAFRVRIRLRESTADFLHHLGWGDAVMVSPAHADSNRHQPIGTGPFAFQGWTRGDSLTLSAYPDYWGEAPALSSVKFRFISDPSAAVSAMLAKEVDGFANFPAPESVEMFEKDREFEVIVGTTEGETLLSINHAHPALSDLRVRQAIMYAIDREAIVAGAMFGFGTPIGSHFPPHHPDYVDTLQVYSHDPEKAVRLLASAGYADGLSLRLHLPPPTYARRGGEIVAAQLAAVGIRTEIIPVEWAQWLEDVFGRAEYDLTIVSHTEPRDLDIFSRDPYYFNYDNPAFDALMTSLSREGDPAVRSQLNAQAQSMLAHDVASGFLFALAQVGVWRKGLHGLWVNRPVQANVVSGVSWR